MKNRIEIGIDGKRLEVDEGANVLEAALDAGMQIPHFCYHKKLSITASCRMCLVEIGDGGRLFPACATPVVPGMTVHTRSHRVVEAQKAVMEFLLINHPLDCPVCDQAGECRLQDMAFGYGGGVSRYQEEKRVVLHRDAGPLISMQEMNRCIHCTRCIRFGQEVAGIQELGMVNRSDHAEIVTAQGRIVTSELSGNMIDLCPVGAITSRPFRFTARNWELARHHAISPHDSLGSNLIVQTLDNRVMRVLPQENEAVNECWLSDRDRFSYEGLNSGERLLRPRIKQDNKWIETDWETALDYVVHGLGDIREEDGPTALAGIASPQATTEELFLFRKLLDGLGSPHADFRLRQSDFRLEGKIRPWLGMPVAGIDGLDSAFIIGSFLRVDHPLLAVRFRRAAARGATLSSLHALPEDWLMPVANRLVAPPSRWAAMLAEVLVAVAAQKNMPLPEGFENVTASPPAVNIASTLLESGRHAVFMGNAAAQHPGASELHKMAEWIATQTGAAFGYLTEGANAVGGYLLDDAGRAHARTGNILSGHHQAYLLLHTEPELDAANPLDARKGLLKARMVVVMSPFIHGADYADVMLPVAPFTETSGTYVSCEGRVQRFYGAVKPPGDVRPAWKVLRVLGSLLELDGFDYESPEDVISDALGKAVENVSERLNNFTGMPPVLTEVAPLALERLSHVPSCFSDSLVRRAVSLQRAQQPYANTVGLPLSLCEKLDVRAGDFVTVRQGRGNVLLGVRPDAGLPDGVVHIYAGHPSTAMLGPMFGAVDVRKT